MSVQCKFCHQMVEHTDRHNCLRYPLQVRIAELEAQLAFYDNKCPTCKTPLGLLAESECPLCDARAQLAEAQKLANDRGIRIEEIYQYGEFFKDGSLK